MSLKKFICLIMAVMFVVAYGVIAVSAVDAIEIEPKRMCCDDYRGDAIRIVGHHVYGGTCICDEVIHYCIECETIFYIEYGKSFIPCPH